MTAWQLLLSDPAAPLRLSFMRDAWLVGSLVGVVCAVLSCYLILKGWSLMGDAISHAIFPGVVLAYMIGIPLSIGAFVAGFFCAISTGFIKVRSRIKEDTVMGVVFTGMFAFGLLLFSKIESDIHLNHILFGSLLGISKSQMIQTTIFGVIALGFILIFRRDLLLFCFDPSHARSIGLNVSFLYYLFLALLSLSIVVSIQAVGTILVIAMLITPGCTARLLTSRFDRMCWVAASTALISAFLGVYVSYFINGATGSCIVLVQSFQFLLALLVSKRRSSAKIVIRSSY